MWPGSAPQPSEGHSPCADSKELWLEDGERQAARAGQYPGLGGYLLPQQGEIKGSERAAGLLSNKISREEPVSPDTSRAVRKSNEVARYSGWRHCERADSKG